MIRQKVTELILSVVMVLVISVLLTGCTNEENKIGPGHEPSIIGENEQIYKITDINGFPVTFMASEEDENGNYTGISISTGTFGPVFIQDSKQYKELKPKAVLSDINGDGNEVMLVYMQEYQANYHIVEHIFILDMHTGDELTVDEINEGLEGCGKIDLHAGKIRSGIEINNRYHTFTKVYFYRPFLIVDSDDFYKNDFLTKTELGSNDGVKVLLIEDSYLRSTQYEPDQENISEAMRKWLSRFNSPLVVVDTGNTPHYYNWDVNTSTKLMVTTGQKINGEDILIISEDALEPSVPGRTYVINKKTGKEIENMWVPVLSGDTKLFEHLGISIINIDGDRNDLDIYPYTAVKVKDRIHIFDDWLSDGRFSTIEMSDMDKDEDDEALIILSAGHGTGVSVEKLHVLNTDDFTEVTYMDPLEIINERVMAKINDSKLEIYIDDTLVHMSDSDCSPDDGIGFGSSEQYGISANEIRAFISVNCNKTQFCGYIQIDYCFSDGNFIPSTIRYINDEQLIDEK